MKRGKEYIVFPLDVDNADAAKRLVERLCGHVGMFKVGLELFIRTGPALVQWIKDQAAAGIFLDLKLHDIPATVERAMRGIAELAVDLTTVHCGESQTMLSAAVKGSQGKVKVLGVTVLTSVSGADLKAAGYPDAVAADVTALVFHKATMAKTAGCAGVVCSGHEAAAIKTKLGKAFLTVTPGIRPAWSEGKKDDQQRVMTPAQAVALGADYLVIGRPIRDAADPVEAARRIAEEIEQGAMPRA
ncbi:MAG: orotidine-5'-phosphate decarboxylase [Desulfobacteraceae bacterium]|nr:orotidine-5'-phosphate decarboxylase [Desulfobacteraceae bacterium]